MLYILYILVFPFYPITRKLQRKSINGIMHQLDPKLNNNISINILIGAIFHLKNVYYRKNVFKITHIIVKHATLRI